LQPRGFLHLFSFGFTSQSPSLSLSKKEAEKKKEPDSENGEPEIGVQSSDVFWRKKVMSHCRQVDMKN
jgi:hypothetical protein